MTGIKEFFQSLVADGVIPQEPANYDAVTLKMYIAHLEAENAELRRRAEIAERAFSILWNECKEKLGWGIDCTMWYKKQAEKELEAEKEDKQ